MKNCYSITEKRLSRQHLSLHHTTLQLEQNMKQYQQT